MGEIDYKACECRCHNDLSVNKSYGGWFCRKCRDYHLPKPAVPEPPKCGHCGRILTGDIQTCSNGGWCSVDGQPEQPQPREQTEMPKPLVSDADIEYVRISAHDVRYSLTELIATELQQWRRWAAVKESR
jgi:hypothetical protein